MAKFPSPPSLPLEGRPLEVSTTRKLAVPCGVFRVDTEAILEARKRGVPEATFYIDDAALQQARRGVPDLDFHSGWAR